MVVVAVAAFVAVGKLVAIVDIAVAVAFVDIAVVAFAFADDVAFADAAAFESPTPKSLQRVVGLRVVRVLRKRFHLDGSLFI